MRLPLAGLLLTNDHCELSRFTWIRHDGVKGTEGWDVSRLPPSSTEAIMPGFSVFRGFGSVTSIVNTRLRASALGEMLVTRPEYSDSVILD